MSKIISRFFQAFFLIKIEAYLILEGDLQINNRNCGWGWQFSRKKAASLFNEG